MKGQNDSWTTQNPNDIADFAANDQECTEDSAALGCGARHLLEMGSGAEGHGAEPKPYVRGVAQDHVAEVDGDLELEQMFLPLSKPRARKRSG